MHTHLNLNLDPTAGKWKAKRLLDTPIVHADLSRSIGQNIQGPSLIRVPKWIADPLGQFYLYFADHKGAYIRLAYADQLSGPWRIHEPGALQLADSKFPVEKQQAQGEIRDNYDNLKLPHSAELERSTPHIASPDVHVDSGGQRIVMYYHGLESWGKQSSRVAFSKDGINFDANDEILGSSYLRVVPFSDRFLGHTMPGRFYESAKWEGPFIEQKRHFNQNCRHSALLSVGETLFVFWTEVGIAPEHIKVSWFNQSLPYWSWKQNDVGELLRPELEWEGANSPLEPSIRSVAYGVVNQLRDPAIFVDDGRVFLLYAGGGESAIGIAELEWEAS